MAKKTGQNKTKNSKKNITVGQKKAKIPKMRMAAPGVDRSFLRLLDDPCNAPLVPPPYAGAGSGTYVRTKSFVSVGASAVDCALQFNPSMLWFNGQGSAPLGWIGFESPILWASANTTDTSAGTIYGQSICRNLFGFTEGSVSTAGLAGAVRCIGACIKVHYTGSELSRQGLVSASMGPGLLFSSATTVGGASVNASVVRASMPQADRLGSREHEYKWCPDFNNQAFLPTTRAPTSSNSDLQSGNVLTVAVSNAPAGSIMFEITACFEYEVATYNNSDMTRTVTQPSPYNLNDTIRAIGNIGKWALEPATAAKAMQFAQSAYSGIRTAGKLAATFGAMAI